MTSLDSVDADGVANSLRELGATSVEMTPDGDIDFKLGDLNAFAYYLKPTGYRISFVLALDPAAEQADSWTTAHDQVPVGFVRFVEGDDTSNLLFTVDVERGVTDLALVIDTAIDLLADWNGKDASGITTTLAEVGLLQPPLGADETEGVRTYGPWWWGTRRIDPMRTLYMFDVDEIVTEIIERGPFFAMSHAGHGLNSYGLNLVTTGGPFAVFFQHGFGGVYMSPLRTRLAINEAYSYLHVLLDAEPVEGATNPRWLLAYSEFRGVCGLIDLDEVRTGKSVDDSTTEFDSFLVLVGAAASRAPEAEEFGAAGVRVEWPPYETEDV